MQTYFSIPTVITQNSSNPFYQYNKYIMKYQTLPNHFTTENNHIRLELMILTV